MLTTILITTLVVMVIIAIFILLLYMFEKYVMAIGQPVKGILIFVVFAVLVIYAVTNGGIRI